MLGSIAGDIIGSVYEFEAFKREDFPLFGADSFFTDDSVLTVATADKLVNGGDYAALYRGWGRRCPGRGYGGRFGRWLKDEAMGPYNSYGNGSAMRVAPVGYAFDELSEVVLEAARSAAPTHNHPEGVKGAQAAAAAVFLARKGESKKEIAKYITKTFGYDLTESVEQIRQYYKFDESCQGTVPQAIICYLQSRDYEDAVRKAVSLGGDADTLACIAGGIAQAAYGLPAHIANRARGLLTAEMLAVLDAFEDRFMRAGR